MTKESVLKDITGSPSNPAFTTTMISPRQALEAMEIYSKQQIILFAHWYANTNYYLNLVAWPPTWDWESIKPDDTIEPTKLTDQQLYEIFVKSPMNDENR